MDGSPLIKLPPEIRNYIYELLLKQTQTFVLHNSCTRIAWSVTHRTLVPTRMLALTETCKAIHEECTPLFYGINKFMLLLPLHKSAHLGSMLGVFMRQIGTLPTSALRFVSIKMNRFSTQDLRDGKVARVLCSIIGVVRSKLCSTNTACKVRLKFGLTYFESNYDAVLDAHRLVPSWNSLLNHLQQKREQGWRTSDEVFFLQQFVNELARYREMARG